METSEAKSEVAQLMRRIALEYEAAERGLFGFAEAAASTSLSPHAWKILGHAMSNWHNLLVISRPRSLCVRQWKVLPTIGGQYRHNIPQRREKPITVSP